MAESTFSIRPIKTWEECLAVVEIQNAVWQSDDGRFAVPPKLLMDINNNGGLLLGAFIGERMIGFVLSFLGTNGQKHCSDRLAVLPEYRTQKIGERLKLRQREYVLAQGIELITWTFDPLQAINANLNLARLGAIARTYIPNAYGEMTDSINVGLPSDRFEAEWRLNSPNVQEHIGRKTNQMTWETFINAGIRVVFEIGFDSDFPRIEREYELSGDSLLVEIPTNIGALKSTAPSLAQEWRLRTRSLFERAFGNRYAATDFLFWARGKQRRAAYVLARTEDL